MVTIEKISEFISKFGFNFIGSGRGIADLDGCPSFLYQKDIIEGYRIISQRIQLSIQTDSKGVETVTPVFSNNISIYYSNQIYEIIKESKLLNECSNVAYYNN